MFHRAADRLRETVRLLRATKYAVGFKFWWIVPYPGTVVPSVLGRGLSHREMALGRWEFVDPGPPGSTPTS